MVSSTLIYDIIDVLMSWYKDLSSATSGLIDLLSTEVLGVSIGGIMFGIGFPVYIGYLISRWIISPT